MTMIRNILIITIIAALVPTAMSSVSASAASEIALFSTASYDSNGLSITGNGDSAKMELKATNDNGKSNRVSGFQLTADNVLSIEVGDKVTVTDNVDFTKAITADARNNQKAIGITSNGVIDFTGYGQGVYTLDVVVDDDRAYEAIIVIGQQPQQVVNKEITKVNNKVITDVEIKTVFEFPKYKPIKCDDGYVWNHYKCVPKKFKDPGRCWDGSKPFPGGYCLLDPVDKPKPIPIRGDTGCNDGSTPVNGICPRPDPNGDYCVALGCPGSPPYEPIGDELIPIEEPEPEPIDCNEGEELVDGQCQLVATNPEEPYDLVPIEGEELDDPEEELDEVPEEEEAEEESGGSEDEVENDDDEEGGGDSEESNEGEESDDSGGETSE